MLQEIDWSEDRSYRSKSETEPIQFYLDALCNSKQFDLLLGYFSSAAINVLSLGFATFLYSGGSVRIVVNHVLSKTDRDAIKSAQEGDVSKGVLDFSDIKQLRRSLDEYGTHFFECLAWLIANNRIQIKIIKPKDGSGIAHYKSGAFHDGEDTVGFKASCNFTFYGLVENLEELDAFLSWENSRSSKMISRQRRDFENIFAENAEFAEYLDVDEVTLAIKNEFGDKNVNELIVQEKDLLERKSNLLNNKRVRKVFEKAIINIEEINRAPKFPYPSGAREYQIEAYEKWVSNGQKGIFAMATGTGKTITSLNCLLNLYKLNKSYKAVILVPTIALLEQWKKECKSFNFRNIITVSSQDEWNNALSFFNTANKLFDSSFIVIVTYASFIRPKFQSHFELLPKDTLLIADEVHNMGAPSVMKLLPKVHLEYRIGLSATPHRKYDNEGNVALLQFFDDKPPYTYSFSMEKALEMGWLCKYTYYPHLVSLTEVEMKEYIRLSKKLMAYIEPSTGRYKECKEVEDLLLMRKRIIHKAENKKVVFRNIAQNEFRKRGTLKYTLVYVPEGVEADYEDYSYTIFDEYQEDDDEVNLINVFTKLVSDTDESVMVKQYTSSTSNRPHIIEQFSKGEIHVLTSMKCLDEGVDVPRSELAIFCASTGNPRQFIQRRGRVLRKHREKIHAVIHDLVVIPEIGEDDSNFQFERSMVRNELSRVIDFANLSMNPMDTFSELKEVLDYYNLNIYDSVN